MKREKYLLLLIFVLTLFSIYIDLPSKIPLNIKLGQFKLEKELYRPDINISLGPLKFKKEIKTRLGLDLQGGTHLVLEADMKEIDDQDRDSALQGLRNVIEKRINLFGVSEPVIQSSKVDSSFRIIVELPGIKDVDQAIALIGKTAQLSFQESIELPEELEATPTAQFSFLPTELTGKHLSRSLVQFDQQTGQPVVTLEFNQEGGELFEEITKRNIGKPVAIFLDDQIVSAPKVEEAITGGQAIIRGQFDLEQAKELSIQLNAGALPAPVEIVEQRSIGATLGEQSVQKSAFAGAVGLILVGLFMWAFYGKLGFLANIALIIYGLLSLAIFKLGSITLTLPGIAGFILSIGMAVDANILIFERIREETRAGRPLQMALRLGFGRAWDSIRDANFTALLICLLLFNPAGWGFLPTFGMIRGFAATLGIGIIVGLFTGIVVTRTLVRVFYKD
ncbi:protein translocase subunit SecD [Candidatus Microgenomates bacterium]|nr:protein translocase subunit SecD [Candidatus Microgenomates bacterium]